MTRMIRQKAPSRRWAAGVAILAVAATPKLALACWTICTSAYGYEFAANETYYQLVSCTQTWPDGSNGPHTVCRYRNIGPDGL